MINEIDTEVKFTKTVVIPQMQTCKVSGIVKLPYLSKRINVAVEDNFSLLQQGVELIPSFEHMTPGSN